MTFTSIALKNLTLWKGNVRRTNAAQGIDELAASIRSVGLLQSLVVIRQGNKFAVAAGGRRLMALLKLLAEGHIASDYAVPCQIAESEQALEASLAENVIRQSMHPADQFEAFKGLAGQGLSHADIAARFGVSEHTVLQRLKLARVAPAILKAYREGHASLEVVMAFAVTDDPKAQLKVWKGLADYQRSNAHHIRSALTDTEIDASDRRVRFVTLEAYEQAGGATRRDLFTEGEDGIFIIQPDLLDDLVSRKVAAAMDDLLPESWAWTEFRESFDYAERSKFRVIHPDARDLPELLQSEWDALEAERDALCERDEDSDQARLNEIESRLGDIEDQRTHEWPEGTKNIAGVVVTLDHDGELAITRGLIRPEDVKREREAKPKEPGALPQSLVRDLRAQHSAALSAEMMEHTSIALAAIVHKLLSDVFFVGESVASCLRVKSVPNRPDEGSLAWEILAQAETAWAERLPKSIGALWNWCVKQEQDVLLDLLAFCTALSVNAISYEDELFAKTLNLDMRKYFTATADNYFSRVSKAQIIEALTEAKGTVAPAWEKAKKGELAAIAERELAGTGWLPKLLRSVAAHLPTARPAVTWRGGFLIPVF